MLYIVSTPIGNLQDVSLRAIETLKKVDLIAAEDTRHTRILTAHYNIETSITSYFEHNQVKKTDYLLSLLKEGKDIALVTDAGTPGISDPGYPLITMAKENNIPMTVIPGASALLAALVLSGLPMHSFIFEGFLPVKSAARRKKLEEFRNEHRTIIFYESPHRIQKTMNDIQEVLDDPVVVCCRELTKKFEEVKTMSASQWSEYFSKMNPRGEYVLVLNLNKE